MIVRYFVNLHIFELVNISHYIFMSTLGFNDELVNIKIHNKIM